MIKIEKRLLILKLFLWIMGLFLTFWWPLSHWFYSDWYHTLLGFEIGSYQDSMVKVIGTIGIIPTLLIFFSANNPIKNRDMIIVLIVFSVLMSITYLHLISIEQFPVLELINVGLLFFAAIFLSIIYPWRHKA